MQHIFNSATRIDFTKNEIDLYIATFTKGNRAEKIPLLLELSDVESTLTKFQQINIEKLSYDLAKMTVTGALYLSTKRKNF